MFGYLALDPMRTTDEIKLNDLERIELSPFWHLVGLQAA